MSVSTSGDAERLSGPTAFEMFALDHSQHHHCMACGGCLLRQDLVEIAPPFWCSACAVRMCKDVAPSVPLPFEGGRFYSQEGVDAYAERKAKEP